MVYGLQNPKLLAHISRWYSSIVFNWNLFMHGRGFWRHGTRNMRPEVESAWNSLFSSFCEYFREIIFLLWWTYKFSFFVMIKMLQFFHTQKKFLSFPTFYLLFIYMLHKTSKLELRRKRGISVPPPAVLHVVRVGSLTRGAFLRSPSVSC